MGGLKGAHAPGITWGGEGKRGADWESAQRGSVGRQVDRTEGYKA